MCFLSRLKSPHIPFQSRVTTADKRAQIPRTTFPSAHKGHTRTPTAMGCTSSRSTCCDSSPLPPSRSTGLRPSQFLPPPPDVARTRTLDAQRTWREKRAELPQLWNSYTEPSKKDPRFQDEYHEPREPSEHEGGIQESFANHGRVSVPLLQRAPATGEQARQGKMKTRGMVH